MPVAAVAKARRAAYHSHTAVFDLRDDCKMVRQKVPGFAPVILMGDPAFRFERSSPERTMDDRLSEEPRGNGRDLKCLWYRLREVGRWQIGQRLRLQKQVAESFVAFDETIFWHKSPWNRV
jgi:hypothetical protein